MMPEWVEAAVVLESGFIKEWKAAGKKVVGYTCSYLPDEVFHAAGILPYRLRGYGAEECTIGDTYFGPFICSLPKCMLQLAGGPAAFPRRRHHHAGLRFDAPAG
jgi:benzoyl-CoA reductase subunit C